LRGDAALLEDASVYRERFNLNTTAAVLRDPGKRRQLVNLVRGVMRTSGQLRSSARDLMPVLAQAIETPERVIGEVWKQFRFPAALDVRQMRRVLEGMEPWASGMAGRKARSREALARLIDSGVWEEARR
jgi:sulfonate transport system substrate-binding protein